MARSSDIAGAGDHILDETSSTDASSVALSVCVGLAGEATCRLVVAAS